MAQSWATGIIKEQLVGFSKEDGLALIKDSDTTLKNVTQKMGLQIPLMNEALKNPAFGAAFKQQMTNKLNAIHTAMWDAIDKDSSGGLYEFDPTIKAAWDDWQKAIQADSETPAAKRQELFDTAMALTQEAEESIGIRKDQRTTFPPQVVGQFVGELNSAIDGGDGGKAIAIWEHMKKSIKKGDQYGSQFWERATNLEKNDSFTRQLRFAMQLPDATPAQFDLKKRILSGMGKDAIKILDESWERVSGNNMGVRDFKSLVESTPRFKGIRNSFAARLGLNGALSIDANNKAFVEDFNTLIARELMNQVMDDPRFSALSKEQQAKAIQEGALTFMDEIVQPDTLEKVMSGLIEDNFTTINEGSGSTLLTVPSSTMDDAITKNFQKGVFPTGKAARDEYLKRAATVFKTRFLKAENIDKLKLGTVDAAKLKEVVDIQNSPAAKLQVKQDFLTDILQSTSVVLNGRGGVKLVRDGKAMLMASDIQGEFTEVASNYSDFFDNPDVIADMNAVIDNISDKGVFDDFRIKFFGTDKENEERLRKIEAKKTAKARAEEGKGLIKKRSEAITTKTADAKAKRLADSEKFIEGLSDTVETGLEL